jgi:GTP pyrophosphokinase
MEKEFVEFVKIAEDNSAGFSESKARKALEIMSNLYKKHGIDQRYLEHNIGVAELVARLKLSDDMVYSALLHNSMRLQQEIPEIRKEFGEEVERLLSEKNKFAQALEGKKFQAGQFELVRMLFFSATKNINTTILQLADKTDELRRIDDLISIGGRTQKDKSGLIELAENVYIPLAFKLGIYILRDECEDKVFEYTKRKEFERLTEKIKESREERMKEATEFIRSLEQNLHAEGINAKIYVREKRASSIYNKILRKKVPLGMIYDIYAARVITNSVRQCYEVLGIVHGLGKPILEEFDDYIAKPKPNGYQSLHTTIMTTGGRPLEIQIRTKEMHNIAESGIAAHWRYKGNEPNELMDRKLAWLKELIQWQSEAKISSGPTAINFFENRIYALTPKGEVIELPEKSTALDFAYAVHSDLGNKCSKIKVNGKIVPLSYRIENADTVQVITSTQQTPKANWLTFVVTEKAKTKIRNQLNIGSVKKHSEFRKISAIKTSDTRIRFGKCCTPVFGDIITGFRTSKRKISVHRKDCVETGKIEKSKIVEVEWANQKGKEYLAEIKVIALDRAGLLGDVLYVFSANKADVVSANAKTTTGNLTNCIFEVKAQNIEQLQKIMERAQKVEGVKSVTRN